MKEKNKKEKTSDTSSLFSFWNIKKRNVILIWEKLKMREKEKAKNLGYLWYNSEDIQKNQKVKMVFLFAHCSDEKFSGVFFLKNWKEKTSGIVNFQIEKVIK